MYDSFAAVTQGRVELARLSKGTLTDLSHVLENMLLESDMPGVVLTGFQVGANWNAEVTRYQRLVEPDARTVAVFANGALGDTGEVIGFALPPSSGLRQEWFIVVQAEQFSCSLFGVDRPDVGVDLPIVEMDRLFDATWTFDPVIIGELSDLVLRVARISNPAGCERLEAALLRFPPRTASRELEARFHQRMFETLERSRRRWRQQVLREFQLRTRLQKTETGLRHLERLAALGTTVVSLAHEINNPLSAIALASELIDGEVSGLGLMIDGTGGGTTLRDTTGSGTTGSGTTGGGTPDRGELSAAARLDAIASHGRLIADGSARIGRMVHGMLAVARTGEVELESVALVPWLRRLTEEISVGFTHPVLLLAAGDVRVSVDTDRVRHVMTNLIRNAAEADPTGAAIEVEVEAEVEATDIGAGRLASHVTVLVRDHGLGMSGDVVERLFQPFVTTKTERGGTGLGLMLAQRFAQDCGGTLTLRTTNRSGTVFALGLPIVGGTVLWPDAAEVDAARLRSTAPDLPVSDPDNRDRSDEHDVLNVVRRVALVLDDDPGVRAMLGLMMERLGWDVLLAATSDDAVDGLALRACDVIVADWGAMSEGPGFDVLAQRMELARPGCTARMLIITGSLASSLPEGLAARVLAKPFGSKQLQQALALLTSR